MPPTDQKRRARQFSPDFKAHVVKSCQQPGVSVSSVALAHSINANLLRRWIKEHALGLPWSEPSHPRAANIYPLELKRSIVEQCLKKGMKVTELAYANRLNPNTVFGWIKQSRTRLPDAEPSSPPMLLASEQPTAQLAVTPNDWLPVVLAEEPSPAKKPEAAAQPKQARPVLGAMAQATPGQIDIELNGARLQLRGVVDLNALRVVIEALRR